jgi:phosphoglucomutase
MIDALRARLSDLPGQTFPAGTVAMADEFAYDDPVDGSRSEGQGIRVVFENGSRIVYRLSGTGTVGATLRVYLEAYEDDPAKLDAGAEEALAQIIATADRIAGIRERTGREAPDVKT